MSIVAQVLNTPRGFVAICGSHFTGTATNDLEQARTELVIHVAQCLEPQNEN